MNANKVQVDHATLSIISECLFYLSIHDTCTHSLVVKHCHSCMVLQILDLCQIKGHNLYIISVNGEYNVKTLKATFSHEKKTAPDKKTCEVVCNVP